MRPVSVPVPEWSRLPPFLLNGKSRCRRNTAASPIFRPIADVFLGRVVVPPVYLPKPGTVKVHGDGWFFGLVTYPVNTPLIRQHGRDPVFPSPPKQPELLQASIIGQGAVVGTFVAFFQGGSHDTTEGSPGGMVVNPGCRTRRPDEDLQRVGAVGVVVAVGYVPVLGPSRFLQKRQDVRGHKVGIRHDAGQDGNGLLQGQLRSKNVEVTCV